MNKELHGDCLELMKDIPSGSIDMILCDLPYGTTRCKWDSIIPLNRNVKGIYFKEFVLNKFKSGNTSYNDVIYQWEKRSVDGLWENYKRIIKPNGAIVLTAQAPFDKVLGDSNLEMLKYEWIWQKTHPTGHLNAKKMPMKAHENVLVFYKKPPTYNPQKTQGHKRKVSSAKHKLACDNIDSEVYNKGQKATDYDSTERYPLSVQVFKSDKQKSSLNPTQKPVGLFKYFVETYSNEGDLVLDNTAGSFTTAIACLETDRFYYCIEKDEDQFNQGLERIAQWRENQKVAIIDQKKLF